MSLWHLGSLGQGRDIAEKSTEGIGTPTPPIWASLDRASGSTYPLGKQYLSSDSSGWRSWDLRLLTG